MERRIAGVLLTALALGAVAAEPVAAQERGGGLLPAGAAFLGLGFSGIGTGDLEDRLATRGYPTFGSSAVVVGIGAYGILPGGLTLGGEWNGLIIGDSEHDGRDVGLGGGYGTIGLGYMVELSPRVRVYPRIGLGGGQLGFWMQSDSGDVDFDDVLADPPEPAPYTREPVLSHFSAVVDLGAGAEILPGGWGRGLVVGLRLGYLVAPFTSNWQLHDQTVNSGPATSIAGPYIRAVVGIGKRRTTSTSGDE